eukprot:5760817-Amphidinium_carterae.1
MIIPHLRGRVDLKPTLLFPAQCTGPLVRPLLEVQQAPQAVKNRRENSSTYRGGLEIERVKGGARV